MSHSWLVSPATCKHEIEELLEAEALSAEARQAILFRNAQRLYGLPDAAGTA